MCNLMIKSIAGSQQKVNDTMQWPAKKNILVGQFGDGSGEHKERKELKKRNAR